jgi:ubiquinone/menaquinone biosynthesis C-methylase UbiE
MSVASHLAIDLDEYDGRIRTFIPDYEDMLDAAAAVVRARRPRTLVDLGTGTGALAARIARHLPRVTIVGVDEDAGMLEAARRRLPRARSTLLNDSFLRAPLPRCDAVTASFALHHVASPRVKSRLFAHVRTALRRGGTLVSADCHPSSIASLAAAGHAAWQRFLAVTYGPNKARGFLQTWAKEDFYTTLEEELRLLRTAGFETDVVWRRNSFAVIVGERN